MLSSVSCQSGFRDASLAHSSGQTEQLGPGSRCLGSDGTGMAPTAVGTARRVAWRTLRRSPHEGPWGSANRTSQPQEQRAWSQGSVSLCPSCGCGLVECVRQVQLGGHMCRRPFYTIYTVHSITPKGNPAPIPLQPQAPDSHSSAFCLSVPVGWPSLDISPEWHSTACGLLSRASVACILFCTSILVPFVS